MGSKVNALHQGPNSASIVCCLCCSMSLVFVAQLHLRMHLVVSMCCSTKLEFVNPASQVLQLTFVKCLMDAGFWWCGLFFTM